MRVSDEMIAPELRGMGRIIRFFLPYFTRRTLFVKAYITGVMRGKMRSLLFSSKDEYIKRSDGSLLRLCLCEPKEKGENSPVLLWLHGGGFAFGVPEQDKTYIQRFITEGGCTVVAPDYRLSTEKPYPAALEDCYAVLVWIKENCTDLGIDPNCIFVGGMSAGGGLTAALCIYARDKKEVAVAYQMPLYPMLDDRMDTASMKDNDAPSWNARSNENAWKLYLNELCATNEVPSYAAPSREKDLSGLPPACSFIGTADPFYDETVLYMKELEKAGVPVDFAEFEGGFHAFEKLCPKAPVSRRAIDFMMRSFRYALENYRAEQPKAPCAEK